MLRAERLLLKGGRLAQELLGGGVVAGRGRLFGLFDDRVGFARFRHSLSRQDPTVVKGAVNLARITNCGQL